MAEPVTIAPNAAAASATSRRLEFLDAARGLAALSVCLQHLCEQQFEFFRHECYLWFNFGAFGVAVFFLISGFIIPATLEKYATLGRFWTGRILRLFPMYLFAMVIVFTLAWFGQVGSPLSGCRHMALCLLADLTMLEEFVRVPPVFGAAWTLGLEMVFYILCSIVWWLGWRRYPVLLAVAGIMVTGIASTAGLFLHRGLPIGRIGLLATCFFGSMVYQIYRGRVARTALWLLVPLAIVLLEGFWLRFHLYQERDIHGQPYFSFLCVCFSWGAAYALFFGLYALRARAFPHWLLWLGKVSYSFYIVADILPPHLPGKSHSWFWIVESLAVSLALSACTYRWIERPAMLLGPKRSTPTQQNFS